MAARIIHFGWDDCYRVQVLRAAGFEVKEADSLDTLELDLQRDEQVNAVIVSEENRRSTEQALRIVRRRSLAPIILFRRTEPDIDQGAFDRVYSWCVPPEEWLSQTAELIAKGRALQEQSTRLIRDRMKSAVRRPATELPLQVRRTRTVLRDPWRKSRPD